MKLAATVLLAGWLGIAQQAVSVQAVDATAVVDYEKYELVISPGSSDNYVFVEVSKKGGEDFKPTTTYSYEVAALRNGEGKVAVDLSFLNAKKTQYVRVYGDCTENMAAVRDIEIAGQPGKLTIKYLDGKKTLQEALEIKQGGDKVEVTLGLLMNYEYKSLYGSKWESLNNFDFKAAEMAGTTILVHEKQSVNPLKPIGADVKIKIKAAAKPPKVTIDYVKGTIKFPKGAEWVKLGRSLAFASPATTDKINVKDLQGIVPGDKIAVRIKATEKKAASNVAVVSIPRFSEIEVVKNADKVVAVVDKTNKANRITWGEESDKIVLMASGSSFDYSFDGKSWKTLKAGATKKLSYEKDAEKMELYFRKAGMKPDKVQDGCFPSVSSEKITLTKGAVGTPPPTMTPTPTPTPTEAPTQIPAVTPGAT